MYTIPDDVSFSTSIWVTLADWCKHVGTEEDIVLNAIDKHVTWGERGTLTFITRGRLRDILYAEGVATQTCVHFSDEFLICVG